MHMPLHLLRRYLSAATCLLMLSGVAAFANEQKFAAKLIWGTDEAKPTDAKLKEVDPKLKEKFANVFKWKHYFEVDQQHFAVTEGANKRQVMSPKCDIEVKNEGKGIYEVKLWGEGKCIKKVRQAIPAGEILVLAGDDKNATAWFVVLKTE